LGLKVVAIIAEEAYSALRAPIKRGSKHQYASAFQPCSGSADLPKCWTCYCGCPSGPWAWV